MTFFIIQNKQTAGIICEVNTLCMDNLFYSKDPENRLSVSFLVCFSLSLSVAVRLSGCIPDKKLLNKGINTAICEIKRNSNVSRRYMS